ncbi:hypothetical protein CC80DRAFT_207945 [Byssothecium circinans]|uniref:Complex 1 LYR protein domain-containing protein n=1 Tax=Byssothecium circinans TaxID=147558 RepID=A0A6A5TRC3_9PLEO|nr:hypothetical protein CC80DRAFT_207945 [Byssothecium circinans]
MPRYLPPKNSTQHRVAAIALYRALLSRCPSAPLPVDDRTALRNAIRNKFRRNRKIQSSYQLRYVFRAGYEVLQHLDAAETGDITSISSLNSLISTLPQGLKRTPPLPPPLPTPDPSKKRLVECLPLDRAVLNVRPYAKVSGPRHVPILASANGVPFLRLKKPQPPALSRILRQKLQTRIDNFDSRILFANYWLPLGRYEDDWDDILKRECGVGREGHMRWADPINEALRESNTAYDKILANDKCITRKMLKIVDEETKLAELEGQKVVRGRKGKPIKSRWLT